MTPEELNEVARFWTEFRSDSPEAQVIAGLQSALRASQAAVAQMREDAARVADVARGGVLSAGGFATADRIAKAIRALPAPVARTYDDARREGVQAAFDAVHRVSALPYMDSPRSAFDAARIMREACQDAIAALLSPAPAVAPVAAPSVVCEHCEGRGEVWFDHDLLGNPIEPQTAPCPRCRRTEPLSVDAAEMLGETPVAAPKPGPTKIVNEIGRVPFDAEAALDAIEESLARSNVAIREPLTLSDMVHAIHAGLDAGRGAR